MAPPAVIKSHGRMRRLQNLAASSNRGMSAYPPSAGVNVLWNYKKHISNTGAENKSPPNAASETLHARAKNRANKSKGATTRRDKNENGTGPTQLSEHPDRGANQKSPRCYQAAERDSSCDNLLITLGSGGVTPPRGAFDPRPCKSEA